MGGGGKRAEREWNEKGKEKWGGKKELKSILKTPEGAG